jgi:hypothetical protein
VKKWRFGATDCRSAPLNLDVSIATLRNHSFMLLISVALVHDDTYNAPADLLHGNQPEAEDLTRRWSR